MYPQIGNVRLSQAQHRPQCRSKVLGSRMQVAGCRLAEPPVRQARPERTAAPIVQQPAQQRSGRITGLVSVFSGTTAFLSQHLYGLLHLWPAAPQRQLEDTPAPQLLQETAERALEVVTSCSADCVTAHLHTFQRLARAIRSAVSRLVVSLIRYSARDSFRKKADYLIAIVFVHRWKSKSRKRMAWARSRYSISQGRRSEVTDPRPGCSLLLNKLLCRFLKPVGIMELRYVRMLSSLCAHTYCMEKLTVRPLLLYSLNMAFACLSTSG